MAPHAQTESSWENDPSWFRALHIARMPGTILARLQGEQNDIVFLGLRIRSELLMFSSSNRPLILFLFLPSASSPFFWQGARMGRGARYTALAEELRTCLNAAYPGYVARSIQASQLHAQM